MKAQFTVSSSCVRYVLLYTDRQIRKVKSFSFVSCRGTVWSFDKTFNLTVYVTVSAQQNLALNRCRAGNAPVFFSPMFIHGQSDS